MAEELLEGDAGAIPYLSIYLSILKAIEAGDLFSYDLDFEALTNLIEAYYDACLRPVDIEPEIKEKFKTAFVRACVSYVRQRLSHKMVKGCQELVAEAFTFSLPSVLKSFGAPDSFVNKSKISTKTFENALIASRKNYIAPLKEHFLRDSSSSEASYDLTELSSHYQELLPRWKLAKADAKRDQKHSQHMSNWRDRLSTYQLPEDLIEWLNQSDIERDEILNNLASFPYLQKRLVSGYALIKPSELALEHSARLCGAEPYFYSTAHLFEVVKQYASEFGKICWPISAKLIWLT